MLAALVCAGVALLAALVLFAIFTVNNRPPVIHIRAPKMPKPNAWDDFVRASMMIKVPGPVSSGRPINSWTDAEYEHFMRANNAALAAFRAALSKPYRHPPVRAILGTPYMEYARLREFARTLLSESMYYERRGDYGRAMNSRLDCIEFGAILPRGGPLVAGTSGVVIEALGAHKMGRLLPRLSLAELDHAAARLNRIRGRRAQPGEVCLEEANAATAINLELLRDPELGGKLRNPLSWVSEKDPFGFYPLGPPRMSTARRVWGNACFALGNKRKMVMEIRDYWRRVAAEVGHPYTGKLRGKAPDNLMVSVSCSVSVMLGTSGLKVHRMFAGSEANLALIEIEMALRRYKTDHGVFPARLAQLAPTYLKRVQRDPFGGKPLRYKVLKGGTEFLVYSIGENLKDDGGRGRQFWLFKPARDIVLERK